MRISDWSSDVCSSDLREHDLQSAIGDDLVGDIDAIDDAGLGPALDDWQEAKSVACDIGKGRRDDRRLAEAGKFVEQNEQRHAAAILGSVTSVTSPATWHRCEVVIIGGCWLRRCDEGPKINTTFS